MGVVLLQEDGEGQDHPICFFSRKFNCHPCNYCASEKETLALILSLQHFEAYLSSTVAPVLVFTDHVALSHIRSKEPPGLHFLRRPATQAMLI